MIDTAKEIDAFLELVKHHLEGWISSGLDKNGVAIKPDLSNIKRVSIKAVGGVPVSAIPECDDPAFDDDDSGTTFAPSTVFDLWDDEGSDEVTNRNHGSKEVEVVEQIVDNSPGFKWL